LPVRAHYISLVSIFFDDGQQGLHRLDRVTAGLVKFSYHPDIRHYYQQLFKTREINKTYQAIAEIRDGENITSTFSLKLRAS
jgi:tRNA pseudouridine32 synthase/23S rRNA pseudouridine746 synthase